jgi:hypothetical protein
MNVDGKEAVLIGGRALVALGSSRNTQDTDYLVNDESTDAEFIRHEDGDLINANGHPFFKEIWGIEKGREIASPQGLLELKVFAFVQHCENGFWKKADQAEFDIKFLARQFNLTAAPIAEKYISAGAKSEVRKILLIRK